MPAATSAVLPAAVWRARAEGHASRADALTVAVRARHARGEKHPIEDFLRDYYGIRPGPLARWHPGAGTCLAPDGDGPAPQAGWRWYAADDDGVVGLDVARFLTDRGDTVRYVRDLLAATASRPAFTGCFGLHEWAMVYRQGEHRHALPLRLGQAGTDAVVEGHRIRCSHIDAFRFFTPEAVGRNELRPTRETQPAMEQPGCLHANMDCLKWALKLGPAVPGDLLLDCYELARDIRYLDMQASPYDVSSLDEPVVAIETPDGKAEYVRRQRAYASRAAGLRERLLAVCAQTLAGTSAGPSPSPRHHVVS